MEARALNTRLLRQMDQLIEHMRNGDHGRWTLVRLRL